MELAGTARREQATYKQFLLDLLQVELADRDVRRQQRLLRLARFPRPKRLEDFDFTKPTARRRRPPGGRRRGARRPGR
ncbi:ATP-binding protein [Kitasatospora sp. NPDC088548]|uniref:ATP-binding protein n=1 Tax=Kitasatospora sp. NPDC088548 TaxID=3364075 RepID=UPI003820B97E